MKTSVSKFLLYTLLTMSIVACSTSKAKSVSSDSQNEWQTIEHYQVKDDLVKDTKTGLMWMRCGLGQKWNGSSCQGEATKYSWNEVMQVTDYLSRHAHAGYGDWRLPKREELKTLVHCSSGQTENAPIFETLCKDSTKPTIDKAVFPETSSSGFWSSSPCDGNSGCVWSVNFATGGYHYGDIEYDNFVVRLVREAR